MEDVNLEKFYKDIIQGWMMGDLHTAARKENGANFITALGCFVCTEAIGLYLPHLDKEIEDSLPPKERQRRFYRCFFKLESRERLMEYDKKIRKSGVKNGIYQIRHRFAHKYLPNLVEPQHIPVRVAGSHNVERLQELQDAGLFFPVALEENDGKIQNIAINNVKYIEELQKLVDYAYSKIFIEKDDDFVTAMRSGYNELIKDD